MSRLTDRHYAPSNQAGYDLHVKAWKDINYVPTKKELDELAFLYKVGKYAPKKGKNQ